jgi:hypothetical protein
LETDDKKTKADINKNISIEMYEYSTKYKIEVTIA